MKPNRWLLVCAIMFLQSVLLCSQDTPQGRVFVNFVSAKDVTVIPGHSSPVQFNFQVQQPYHINSSKPLAEELIPTQLHFSLPGEVAVGKMEYPQGQLMSFPFDPSTKLSVYSGDFS